MIGVLPLAVLAACADDSNSDTGGTQAYVGATWNVVELKQTSPTERDISLTSSAWIRFDDRGRLIGHDLVQKFTAPYTATESGYHAPLRPPANFGWYATQNDALMDEAITTTVTGGDVTVTELADGKLKLEADGRRPGTHGTFTVILARQ